MKLLASLTALTSLAGAVVVGGVEKRDSPFDVKLEKIGNTEVKAIVTNTGATDLKVFKTGTFLDSAPVEKVQVLRGSENVPFDGVRLRVSTTDLTDDAFQVIPAGETVEATFDVAELHDLSEGGAFDLLSEGAISYAEIDSTEITGVSSFASNLLSAVDIDGGLAAKVRSAFLEKRTAVQNDCSGTRRTATVNAITRCRSLAQAAASAAQSNTAKVNEYFKSTTSSTRSTVANVFTRAASECGSTTGGSSRYYCSDVYGACSSGVLAYTLPSQSYMVNCPLFFSGLSATSRTCHAQDQQTTVLHEITHLTQVAGTSDLNGYGYNYIRSLSTSQSLRHADTYTLFAQSIFANC